MSNTHENLEKLEWHPNPDEAVLVTYDSATGLHVFPYVQDLEEVGEIPPRIAIYKDDEYHYATGLLFQNERLKAAEKAIVESNLIEALLAYNRVRLPMTTEYIAAYAIHFLANRRAKMRAEAVIGSDVTTLLDPSAYFPYFLPHELTDYAVEHELKVRNVHIKPKVPIKSDPETPPPPPEPRLVFMDKSGHADVVTNIYLNHGLPMPLAEQVERSLMRLEMKSPFPIKLLTYKQVLAYGKIIAEKYVEDPSKTVAELEDV